MGDLPRRLPGQGVVGVVLPDPGGAEEGDAAPDVGQGGEAVGDLAGDVGDPLGVGTLGQDGGELGPEQLVVGAGGDTDVDGERHAARLPVDVDASCCWCYRPLG